VREAGDRVEAIGVERATSLVDAADVLVWMGDPECAPRRSRTIWVHGKVDLAERKKAPEGTLAVSARTGEGLAALMDRIQQEARAVLPADDAISLNRRQATHIGEAAAALTQAAAASESVILAEELRLARRAFDQLTGRAGVEDVLDSLFGRFCLGK
jgi:tRNA modification GTPase